MGSQLKLSAEKRAFYKHLILTSDCRYKVATVEDSLWRI